MSGRNRPICFAAIVLSLFCSITATATTIYVSHNASAPGNGQSWQTAYKYLQDALTDANTAPKPVEIRVAAGRYHPDQGNGFTPGDRTASFQLINNVTLTGGYAGPGESNPDAYNPEVYETILSGDLHDNDLVLSSASDMPGDLSRAENSHNVITASGCERIATVKGVTITGGHANYTILSGGGVYGGRPTIDTCTIVWNYAQTSGGGIWFQFSNHTTPALVKNSRISYNASTSGGGIHNCVDLVNCIINDNQAIGGFGGGVNLTSSCESTITDCLFLHNFSTSTAGAVAVGYSDSVIQFTRCDFIDNMAGSSGGAILADGCTCGSDSYFYYCRFINNAALLDGGAICNYGFSNMEFYSCLLLGNTAGRNGGAMGNTYDGGSILINCTIANNAASGQGGGLYYKSSGYKERSMENTIVWFNTDKDGQESENSQIFIDGIGSPSVNYCCIQGSLTLSGIGHVRTDPLFIDPDGDDNIPGTDDDDLHLQPGSPCINTGSNSAVGQMMTDLDGGPRIVNGTVDMGAYEAADTGSPVRYVDDNANTPGDGLSWQTAYRYLQDALLTAAPGYEIRVAQGTYTPDLFVLSDRAGLGRAETFSIPDGVILRGGFAGINAPDPHARDIDLYETVLSGDLAGNDIEITNPYDLLDHTTRQDNCYHIVTLTYCSPSTILDGFTISGGNANGGTVLTSRGGGVYGKGQPVLTHCRVISNSASSTGGGVYFDPIWESGLRLPGGTLRNTLIRNNAAPSGAGAARTGEMTDCIIEDNHATYYGGGGLYLDVADNSPLTDCIFRGNSAPEKGGGLWMVSCSPRMKNCQFVDNHTNKTGGAIYMDGCSTCQLSEPTLENCQLISNSAGTHGGGYYCTGETVLVVSHCTITDNTTPGLGGGIFHQNVRDAATITHSTIASNTASQGGGMSVHWDTSMMSHCIFWGNIDDTGTTRQAQIDFDGGTESTIDYSCIQQWDGALSGQYNMDADPLFADAANQDYHLRSQGGRWSPAVEQWILDDVTSPCIDAGNALLPIGPEPFPNGGRVNIGAYGGTAEASKSYFGKAPCETIVAGDINGDCKVNFTDVAIMLVHWLEDNSL